MKKREKTTVDEDAPRSRRKTIIGVGIVVVVMALVAAGCVWWGSRPKGEDPSAKIRTAKVERTSLVSAFVLSGTLGYGDINTLGGGGGVVTKVPKPGDTVTSGQVIMEVEGVPVFLLRGELPLWRDIAPGTSGPDVAAVRTALDSLGINAGAPAGQSYDTALSNAIAALYSRAGYSAVPPTKEQQQVRTQAASTLADAKVHLTDAQATLKTAQNRRPSQSEIVAADNAVNEARRVYQAMLRGECPSTTTDTCTQSDIVRAQEALTLAQAERDDLNKPPDTTAEQAAVASAQRSVQQAQDQVNQAALNIVGPQTIIMVSEPEIRINSVLAKVGLQASDAVLTWTKPELYGHVDLTEAQRRLVSTETQAVMTLPDGTEVPGAVTEITEATLNPQTGQTTPAKARIEITDSETVAKLEVSAITVSFIQDEVEDTLVVPVTALMALAEGGYCVELTDGTLIAVEIGLVADTRVQVFSDQLHEGDEVIVP